VDPVDPVTRFMLLAAWAGMAGGVLSGAVIGLFFHDESFMGGYQSFRRRLARLGHISFFGLAFVNVAFAVTNHLAAAPPMTGAAAAFLVGAVAMPTCCFLTAWKKEPFRHLFFIPVSGIAVGIVLTLIELGRMS
jgi:hypothetical protein